MNNSIYFLDEKGTKYLVSEVLLVAVSVQVLFILCIYFT